MKRQYPYLQDSYFQTTIDEERIKRNILKDIDDFVNQKQYVRITLLDWEEHPIKDIEGLISSGSISKNGDSPVRRSVSLACAVDTRSYDLSDTKADFAINKKVFLECGVRNDTDQYPDWPIFWFPQGVFYIADFAISSSSSNATNINITLKDKMMGLNGDVGGTLPATVVFDSMDTQLPTGEYITQKVLIYNIIKELVNHYGDEDLNNIVIEDVPLRIKRIMKWNGNVPLYATLGADNILGNYDINYTYSLTQPSEGEGYVIYNPGDDVGYVFDDFVIPDELTGNAGETVVSILDKIKEVLGNYEYFYDEFGVFHFREIKNYLNTTQGKTVLSEMAEKEYLVEVNNERSVYTFTDETLLTSVTVTPQYGNIKNDYIVQGLHQMEGSDISYPIRYHLAIDKKPRPIGKDNEPFVLKRVDHTEDIASLEDELAAVKNRYKLVNDELQRLLTDDDRLKRIIEQREGEIVTDNDNLMYQLMDISEVEYDASIIKTPEEYWSLIYPATGYSFDDFMTDDYEQQIIVLKNIWKRYQYAISQIEPLAQEAARAKAEYQADPTNAVKRQAWVIAEAQVRENASNINDMDRYRGPGYIETLELWYNRRAAEQDKIDATQSELDSLQDRIQALRDELAALQARIDEINAQILVLKEDTSMVQTPNPHEGDYYYSRYNREFILYKEKDSNLVKGSFVGDDEELPAVGNFNKIYKSNGAYYYWDGQTYQLVDVVTVYPANEYKTYDWRTKLYLDGLMAVFNKDTDKGYYYEELAAFWPQVYNLVDQCFYGEEDAAENKMITLTQGYYYLDFLDSLTSSFGEWSVSNIGRRSNVTVEDKINCLFQPEIPNVILIEADHIEASKEMFALEGEKTPAELRQEAIENNMPFTQVEGEIYNQLITGGYKNAAFDQIKYDLFLHTRYQKTVSATAVPVFYLEPNSRVTFSEAATNTYGDFVVQNINITLGPGANMSVACHETLERF